MCILAIIYIKNRNELRQLLCGFVIHWRFLTHYNSWFFRGAIPWVRTMVKVLNICSKKFGFVANSMSCHDVCYGLPFGAFLYLWSQTLTLSHSRAQLHGNECLTTMESIQGINSISHKICGIQMTKLHMEDWSEYELVFISLTILSFPFISIHVHIKNQLLCDQWTYEPSNNFWT